MKDNKRNGIGRLITKLGSISEGQYLNDNLNGFGRSFWSDGNYYIGEFKDHYYHGKGKYVNAYGKIKDGIWEDDKFI